MLFPYKPLDDRHRDFLKLLSIFDEPVDKCKDTFSTIHHIVDTPKNHAEECADRKKDDGKDHI